MLQVEKLCDFIAFYNCMGRFSHIVIVAATDSYLRIRLGKVRFRVNYLPRRHLRNQPIASDFSVLCEHHNACNAGSLVSR